ncbi:MAG: TatD family nuclease-associated radical SAM protein [Candidatus Bathyarchaeia archaeon]|jgi:TatD family-associated radical SAM protein
MSHPTDPQDGAIVYRYSASPNTIYLNITNRCRNSCSFCLKNYCSGISGYRLWLEKEPTIKDAWDSLNAELKDSDKELVFCGFGEPTVRLGMVLELTRMIKEIYPYLHIRLNTDGLAQLQNGNRKVGKELKEAGMDSISISLNAENQEIYNELCKPSLMGAYEAVLDFTKDCRDIFSHVRLSVVNVSDINIQKCKRIADDLDCEFFIR